MIATADFETTTIEEDCRVWAYGICEIGNPSNFIYGNSLDEFMQICKDKNENHTFYFHNLKFDGEFIFYWLFRNGYECVKDRKQFKDKSFCTLISDKGQFYSIEICFKKTGHKINKVVIYDSLKILNFSVKQIAKDFGTGLNKLEMEQGYKGIREVGHILTDDEVMYLRNDVEIMSRALDYILNDRCMDKMTIGADALADYKATIGKKEFNKHFPILNNELDGYIRKSYKGGFTYLADRYKRKVVGNGIVLDVNSLYPSVMYERPLPYGIPLYFKGQYKADKLYNLYVQKISCQFKVKPRHIPTIQIKSRFLSFIPTEYLKDSGEEEVVLTLTNVDLELFLSHYNVFNLEYIDGFKFKSSTELFKPYIDKWINEKIEGKKEGNKGKTKTAKLMLNSLYGKFALAPTVQGKYPTYIEEKDFIKYVLGDEESREPIYVPVGAFVTAWARYKTISSAQKVYDRFIYADTDSLHLEGLEIPKELDVDPYRLGAWDNELVFSKAKYLRQKSYMELGKEPNSEDEEEWKITCAGMPSGCYEHVNIDNFDIGSSYCGKLQHKRVSGGVVLKDVDFTIKR
jgi:hypothetical protein